MQVVEVHPRVHERHPELTDEDVRTAWRNCIRSAPMLDRCPYDYIAIGADKHGRLVELIARVYDDVVIIFHAMTPPTRKAQKELGL